MDSPAARLAYTIRAAAGAGITTALWQGLNLTHGIWLTISAVVVIQPRRVDTWAKGMNRVVGTLIGAAVATVCAAVMPANALTVGFAVALTILLCWGSGRLRDPMPLAALTTVLVFTFDRQEQALAAGFWRCVEIIAGVAIGLALMAIPFRASEPGPGRRVARGAACWRRLPEASAVVLGSGTMATRYAPIGEYGVIGDLYTVALVGMDGSIDFLCLPHFDSPSVFAALVDAERGGRFQIAPLLDGAARKQLYLPDTNVLLTRFLDAHGVAELSDFMPVEDAGQAHNLVRRAKTVRGEVRFQMRCDPRFDYARATHTAERRSDTEVLFVGRSGDGELALRLRSSVPMRVENGAALAEFTLGADTSAWFVLEVVLAQEPSPSEQPDYESDAFKRTVNFWRRWIARSTYGGRWREMVNRSALTLKLLTSRQHGSIVAAPTFGLPETIGGSRNWDYRYTWIRDSSFTLYGLMRLGYTHEAAAFMRWVMARCEELEPDGSLQIMYGLDGRHALPEETLPHLEGYMGSSPVRVGNAAFDNLQLDIYGELMDSIYLYDKYGSPIGYDAWTNVVRLMDWVCVNWRRPDEGIWEVRGGRQEFLYSRVMCWVAVDRAIRLATKRSFPAPLARWYETRDTIYQDVFTRLWDPTRRAFIQHVGATTLDAAALLMPLVRFVSPTDPRWISTLRAIERELVSDSLVYRYRLAGGFSDGLTGEEGTFSMCSFWYVECLSRMGDLDKARFFFEKMLGYANHLGLYGEELGPQAQHLGNFPQAFTHLALISAAFDLDRRLSAAGHAG